MSSRNQQKGHHTSSSTNYASMLNNNNDDDTLSNAVVHLDTNDNGDVDFDRVRWNIYSLYIYLA